MKAGEQSYRLYSCRRCAQQVRVCRHCDRGNHYCAGECARVRRRESVRRAGVRYQLSYRGACCHAHRLVWAGHRTFSLAGDALSLKADPQAAAEDQAFGTCAGWTPQIIPCG